MARRALTARAVLLTLSYPPGSYPEVIHVPLDHARAAELAKALDKHSRIVARKLRAEAC